TICGRAGGLHRKRDSISRSGGRGPLLVPGQRPLALTRRPLVTKARRGCCDPANDFDLSGRGDSRMKTIGALACSLLFMASAFAADPPPGQPRAVTLGGIIHSDS